MDDPAASTLGRYIRVKHGFAFKGEYFTEEVTPYVLVTPGNFAIGGGFQDEKRKYYRGPIPEDYILQSGDLIITMTDLSKAGDTLGYPALIPEKPGIRYLHNQRIGLVEIKDDTETDKRFLYYRLCDDDYRHHVLATASGSTVRHTSPSRISQFETILPDIVEQRDIASVLAALDDKIDQNWRTSIALEQLAEAIYRAWFVNFEPVKARVAGATHFPSMPDNVFNTLPRCFMDSSMGPVPEGWVVRPLTSVATLTMGQSPPSAFYNDIGDGLPFHQGVTDFGFRFPTHRIYCATEGRLADAGDILLSVRAPVGRINVTDCRIVLGRGLAGLRQIDRQQSYLLYMLRYVFADEDSIGEGTVYKAVTKSFLQGMEILVPPLELRAAFEKIAAPMDKLILTNHQEAAALARMRELLLPRFLSGEARVEVRGG